MIARLVKGSDGDVKLLCKNGSISNPTTTVLANFLSNFKDAKHFNGDDGIWSDKHGDMAMYPGETLAYVTDEETLIVFNFDIFKPILSESYRIKNYISITEYALKVNKSREIIKVLCREGRIMGAHKMGGRWMIPEDAPYPIPPARRRTPPQKYHR